LAQVSPPLRLKPSRLDPLWPRPCRTRVWLSDTGPGRLYTTLPMEGNAAQLMSAYGIDEKAVVALQKLAPDMQAACLQKLQDGVNSGKVRNASGFLMGIVTGPDALGIDDSARAHLMELPKPMQVELMNQLRSAPEVQNPSAWIMQAAIKAKKQGGGVGGIMNMMAGGQMMGGQMLGGQMLGGMLGGQMLFGKMGGQRVGGTARASPYGSSSPPTIGSSVPANPEALQQIMMIIDDKAKTMLQQLPEDTQVDLASCLQARIQAGTVQNPSGWMMKSCLGAGAKTGSLPGGNPTPMGGNLITGGSSTGHSVPANPQALQHIMMIIDDKAKTLLQQLPEDTQVDLASCLQAKIEGGSVQNPSGWMMKSCTAAGAKTGSIPGGNPTAMGGNIMGAGAVPANPEALQQVMMVIDDKAKTELQKLPYEKQVDLASCLQSKVQEGKVQNPSGWMMKACMAAGGSMTGMGGNPMAMGSMFGSGLATRSAMGGNPMAMGGNPMAMAMMVLDEKAKALLGQLPHEKQVELSSFLQQKMGDGGIRNPSAWMAKSCIAAGAQA